LKVELFEIHSGHFVFQQAAFFVFLSAAAGTWIVSTWFIHFIPFIVQPFLVDINRYIKVYVISIV